MANCWCERWCTYLELVLARSCGQSSSASRLAAGSAPKRYSSCAFSRGTEPPLSPGRCDRGRVSSKLINVNEKTSLKRGWSPSTLAAENTSEAHHVEVKAVMLWVQAATGEAQHRRSSRQGSGRNGQPQHSSRHQLQARESNKSCGAWSDISALRHHAVSQKFCLLPFASSRVNTSSEL